MTLRIVAHINDHLWQRGLKDCGAGSGMAVIPLRAASWKEFTVHLREGHWDVVVLDPFYDNPPRIPEVRKALCGSSASGIVGYLQFATLPGWRLPDLSRLAFDAVVNHDAQGKRELLRTLLAARRRRRWRILVEELVPNVVGIPRQALVQGLEASACPSVEVLARRCGCSVRTLQRRCADYWLLTPGRLLAWARLLRAADLLSIQGPTVEEVANLVGFSSGASLRKSTQRLVGQTPSSLREKDPFGQVLAAFRRLLTATHVDPLRTCVDTLTDSPGGMSGGAK